MNFLHQIITEVLMFLTKYYINLQHEKMKKTNTNEFKKIF